MEQFLETIKLSIENKIAYKVKSIEFEAAHVEECEMGIGTQDDGSLGLQELDDKCSIHYPPMLRVNLGAAKGMSRDIIVEATLSEVDDSLIIETLPNLWSDKINEAVAKSFGEALGKPSIISIANDYWTDATDGD